MKYRDVLRAIGFPLTPDDISQGSDQNGAAADLHRDCFAAQAVE
jgi:hypothetical protein